MRINPILIIYQKVLTIYARRIESTEESPLAQQLLLSPDDNLRRGVTPEFLKDLSAKFDEDDSLKPAVIAAVEELSAQLSSRDANGDFQPYFTVCRFPFQAFRLQC
jgi:ubiquitin conjugation factor E4 B